MEKLIAEQIEKKKNTTHHDTYDKLSFDDLFEKMTDENKEIEKLVTEETQTYPPLVKLMEDIFYNFFKYKPRFFDDEEIDPRFISNKEIIKKAMKNENWKKMREMTKLDNANSIIATLFFIKRALEEIKKRDNKFLNTVKNIFENNNELTQKIQQYANSKDEDEKKKIEEEIENIKKNIQNNKTSGGGLQLSQISMSSAIKNSTLDMEDFFESINSITWGNITSEVTFTNPHEKIKLANYFIQNKNFADFVKKIGRMKNILSGTRMIKIKHGTNEIYSVETGNDLKRVLPNEIGKLSNPYLKRDFYKKFINRELLQYRLKSKEKIGKGNITVCLDLSGSMKKYISSPFEGSTKEKIIRSDFAKALAIAILDIAIRDNRAYNLIIFESDVKEIMEFSRRKKPTVDDIIKIASMSYSGGTNFENALRSAMDKMNEKSDILFITDGECDISPEFLSLFLHEKKKRLSKVISLQIGDCSTEPLEKFSDIVFKYHDFLSTSNKIFEKMLEV